MFHFPFNNINSCFMFYKLYHISYDTLVVKPVVLFLTCFLNLGPGLLVVLTGFLYLLDCTLTLEDIKKQYLVFFLYSIYLPPGAFCFAEINILSKFKSNSSSKNSTSFPAPKVCSPWLKNAVSLQHTVSLAFLLLLWHL